MGATPFLQTPLRRFMPSRSTAGAHLAEYSAVIMVLFLGITFPLINLATFAYRYNMLVSAAHAAAHAGATAPTFTNPTTGIVAVVPATVDAFLRPAKGVGNYACKYRINSSDISTQQVLNGSWGQKLAAPAAATSIYTLEVCVDADVSPLVVLSSGLVPNVPGLTGPSHYSVSGQELVETTSGLNQ